MSSERRQDAAHPFRMTHQRRVILEELRDRGGHPTAEELHRRVRRRLPNISLGTVYRSLEVLARAGAVRPLYLGARRRRFDGQGEPHYHVRCTACGAIRDVPAGLLPALDAPAEALCGFRITGHRLEFEGLCPRCLAGGQRGAPRRSP